MKILIHADRKDSVDFLSENITNFGYKAGIAEHSSQVTTMLAGNQYTVVIADGALGDPDFVQQIRSNFPSVFLIEIKSSLNSEGNERVGADSYLARPFMMSQLLQAIEKPRSFGKGTAGKGL